MTETNETLRNNLREYPVLPSGVQYDDLSWADRRFVEEYLCNRTSLHYQQENYYDAIGTEAYLDSYRYDFRCELLPIANDKIRIHYWVPVTDPDYRAKFHNSLGREAPRTGENTTTIFFKRTSEFKAYVNCDFDSDLKGLRSWYALFHTRDSKNLTKFNNWNFSSSLYWDSVEEGFWFDDNTTLLVYSITYKIGEEQLENAILRLQPETLNFKEQNVTRSFLSIPIATEDNVE